MKQPYRPMKETWLLQRLEAPVVPGSLSEKMQITGAFVFGGGGHGISEEGMKMLTPIFSFAYMGAAEYEFGAPSQALHRISRDAKDFDGGVLTLPINEVAKHWREDIKNTTKAGRPRKKNVPKPVSDFPVFNETVAIYYFCHKDERTMVENTIRQLAANKYVLRDPIDLNCKLRPMEEQDRRTLGWLELDNGYFFFINEEMWRKTVALFKGV